MEVGVGSQGQMDFVMVHAPAAEEKFVSEGYVNCELAAQFIDCVTIPGMAGDHQKLQT